MTTTPTVYGPRATRIQRGVTVEALAKRSGYSCGYVRQIERAWEIICAGGPKSKGYELATIAAIERLSWALTCLSPGFPEVRYEVFLTMPPPEERLLWGAPVRPRTRRKKAGSSRPACSNGRGVSSVGGCCRPNARGKG